jgi:hypothetical protein
MGILTAINNVQVVVLVEVASVASVEPAVGVECLIRRLGVAVVLLHDVGTLGKHEAMRVDGNRLFGLGVDDLNVYCGHTRATRRGARNVVGSSVHAVDSVGLRHAPANGPKR